MMNILSKSSWEIHGYERQFWLFIFLFLIFWNIEALVGFVYKYKLKRTLVNASFVLANIPGQLLMGSLFVLVIHWDTNHEIGFLNQMSLDDKPFTAFAISFIFLDFCEYIYHRIMHKKRWLWIFHAVHHSDDWVDTSTTLREHPGENFIRQSFTLLWVFLSGTSLWMLMIRQTVQAGTTLLSHVSWKFPEKIDRVIGLIFITPNLHHVHHHYKQPYTDSNYGDVLSIWDRIFGTFKRLPANEIFFGVDTLQEEETGKFSTLIKIPFSILNKKNADKKKHYTIEVENT